ncbi:MAG: hypothetical protein F4045_03265 [Chloroflexi bacterium]|nr:hypothetical protein [Chloroflexota bacterium]MYK34142.1 hypothetical protein [Chloroflexota bacterium]
MPVTAEAPPVLSEEGLRMDWPDARYTTTAKIWSSGASITNTLEGSAILEQLVQDNLAKWVVEVRCPKSLYCRIYEQAERDFNLSWNAADIDGRLFLIPGLVATGELTLPTTELLPGIWEASTVTIPQGWWLAKGQTYANESLSQSLLTFKPDESLPIGCMRVDPETGSGDLRFVVNLAADLYARIRTSRDVQVAGLIGACARLPEFTEGDYPILSEVETWLDSQGVLTWKDENYDPARAATAIEKFTVLAVEEENDD